MKRLLTKLAIIVALIGLIVFGWWKISNQSKEIERQRGNIAVLNGRVTIFKAKDGNAAEQIRVLNLKNDEIVLFNSRLRDQVDNLNIKIRDLKSAQSFETKTIIKEVVKTVVDTINGAYQFKYNDGFNKIHGVSRVDSTELDCEITDSLDVITHVRQKRFLFFRVGKPVTYTTVTNKNTKSTVHCDFSAVFD